MSDHDARSDRRRSAAPRRRQRRGSAGATAVRRPAGGSVLILLVLVVAVGMLTPTVNQLISQQQRIEELRQEISDGNREIDALKREQQRWTDPAYIRSQARGRLLFVEPGDTSYTVLDSPTSRAPKAPVDVAVEQHRTNNDPAARYLESLIGAANAAAPAE